MFDLRSEEPHFETFLQTLHVGQKAPDGPVEALETGQEVQLSSLWSDGFALIEFGSFT